MTDFRDYVGGQTLSTIESVTEGKAPEGAATVEWGDASTIGITVKLRK